MKRVWITGRGEPDVLQPREEPDPLPAAGELRVRVEYAGVNFAEVMARLGLYPDAPSLPFVPGYEVSGSVDVTGDGVDPAWKGQRVTAVTRFGGYSDLVCLPPDLMVRTPDSVPDDVAASLPVNYLTAHQMLHRVCCVRAGETVLVHGAAGGVGIAAVQLCRIVGARVIGTASPAKHDFLRSLDVEPIASRTTDWPDRVRELTAGRGVDIVLDPIGGASFRRSYDLLASGGRLCCFGASSLAPGTRRNLPAAIRGMIRMPRFGAIALMDDNRSVAGVNLGHLWNETEMLRPQFEAIVSHAAAGLVKPVIDRVYDLEQAAAAHARLQSRQSVGKILLRPGGENREHLPL